MCVSCKESSGVNRCATGAAGSAAVSAEGCDCVEQISIATMVHQRDCPATRSLTQSQCLSLSHSPCALRLSGVAWEGKRAEQRAGERIDVGRLGQPPLLLSGQSLPLRCPVH